MATLTAPRAVARDLPPEYAPVPSDQKRVKTTLPQEYRDQPADTPLATFLGLFSLGLGLWEVLAPRDVAHRTGTPYPALVRGYGLREVAAGLMILGSRRPAAGLWARVAGDALDLAALAAAYAEGNADQRRKAAETAAAVLGVTALDVVCARQHTFAHSTC
ncbi:hypothetical protein J0H58_00990 [bacterium]|nr:hypothetical protein [bacterium]